MPVMSHGTRTVWPYGRQFIQGFWVWNVRGGDSLGDLGVDGGGGHC